MGIYLLKFTACLAVLYFFYKLCLENENMHMFKRSYLLVSLAAALLIPALVFTEYVEVPPITNIPAQEYSIPQVTDGPIGIPVALEKEVLDIEPILWAVYFIGVLFFGIKFLKNLIQIFKRIQGNPKQRWQQYFHVLLKEQLPPHTFLSYIFLNKSKFEAGEIPKEVLLHEQTHARQKHSYDILLVEFLQVIFWMNPFIYLLKKAIKLNHEFLADQAVIKKGISQTRYQNTLLSYLSHDSFEKQESTSIANAINYSSIKKRFNIMKTETSKKAILLRSILVLPLFSLLLLGFSETKTIEVIEPNHQQISFETEVKNQSESNAELFQIPQKLVAEIIVNITDKEQLLVQDDSVRLENLESYLAKINPHLSKQEKETLVRSVIYAPTGTSQKLIDRIDAILTDYGVTTIDIVGPEMDIKITSLNATPKQLAEYNKLAKHYNSQSSNKMKIYKKDVERLEYLFSIMSDEQKSNAEPFPDFPEPPPAPKAPNAPNEREEAANTIQTIIEEQDPYDVSNSGIRTNPKGKKVVFPQSGTFYKEMEKDVELQTEKMKEQEILMKNEESKLKEREALMQQEKIKLEKEEAKLKKQEIEMTRQEEKMQEQEEMMKNMEAELEKKEDIFVIENAQVFQYNNKVSSGQRARLREYLGPSDLKNAQFYFEGKKVSSKEGMKIIENEKDIKVETRPHTNKQPEVRIYKATRNKTIPAPPKPPTPVTPLDHVIAMAKKDAQFIFEGKEISSDKAIKLMKTNKDLNIDSRTVKGKKPVVTISASPIPH